MPSEYSWVTLTTNDTYSLGALVLGNSLKRAGTQHQLSCLVTPGVSDAMKQKLKDCYNVVQEVNVMDSKDETNLALLQRPELGITLTKLHCWRLVQFEKCVFLDADTLVLKNCDELFDREELSAAPDVSWPDCFNSGVFVYKPDLDTFGKIVQFGVEHGSFDGGDQGLLNQYFSDWAHKDIKKHLPFTYNTAAYASYCYLPAFKQFKDQIKILHFAGKLKPWLVPFDSATKQAHTPSDYGHAAEYLQLWWNIFCEQVHKDLSTEMNYFAQLITDKNLALYVDAIEFHDPWEDYYETLKQSVNEIELNTDNLNIEYNQNIPISYDNIIDDDSNDFDQNLLNTNNSNKETEFFQQVKNKILNLPNLEITEIVNYDLDNLNKIEEDNTSNSIDINIKLDSCNLENNKNNENDDAIDENISEIIDQGIDEDNVDEAGLAGALASLKLGESRTPEQEAYEQHIRRQCWESGQIDYKGVDSFDNIWKKISETIDTKPTKPDDEPKPDKRLTSADIEDGKVERTSTGSIITYKKIEGGYEQHIVTPQPNGTRKTEVKTFYDPKPVAADQVEDFNRKHKNMKGTTVVTTRKIAGGREETYTTTYADGSQSVQTKTLFDNNQNVDQNNTSNKDVQSRRTTRDERKDNMQLQQVDRNNRQVMQNEQNSHQTEEFSSVKTEEKRRVSKLMTKQVSSSRTDSFEEETLTEKKDTKKVKKPKTLTGPPVPPEFVDKPGEKTKVTQRKVPNGTEFIYTTTKKDGTISISYKTVYEEQEIEMTDEEIRAYQKQLREAEKHKDIRKITRVPSKDGDKKIIPSDRPGDVTTVETKKIAGGTEYHYTTVTSEGLVKKSSKTVYDPVPCGDGESSGEEIVEEYEEEVIEPGESTTRTFETTQKLSSLSERHEIVGKKKLGQSVTVSEVTEERKETKRRERKIKK